MNYQNGLQGLGDPEVEFEVTTFLVGESNSSVKSWKVLIMSSFAESDSERLTQSQVLTSSPILMNVIQEHLHTLNAVASN